MEDENCANSALPNAVLDSDGGVASPSVDPNPELLKGTVQWQETLINLMAAQQQQIAELTKQTKIAMMSSSSSQATPNLLVVDGSNTQASTSNYTFKLTSYDPDNSAYAIHEWLEDATKLKDELTVSDNLMIAKAGETLKNRGNRYCCEWRPIRRTWENLCADLITAFPDKETTGVRAFKAATLRSRDCDSLCDYGNQKFRSIHRFYENFPWDKILSMIEFGLDHAEARASLHIQQPQSDREVMTILSEFDARRIAKRPLEVEETSTRKHHLGARRDVDHEGPKKLFKGSCYSCGRQGHRHTMCRNKQENPKEIQQNISGSLKIPPCNHCKKIGHNESNCWYKNGKPKKTFLLKK
ncbi:unnamed protein product [Psylliodes chrysocephalus]|uniref:CCHC-type domain-containing protein n=1 Tax=Psylliodes chrysocephalus TaxID=3402493 RepID=A0A9P0D6W8_9CUCU|nr:unnamed protein product [Psylliodes chrysocephala]